METTGERLYVLFCMLITAAPASGKLGPWRTLNDTEFYLTASWSDAHETWYEAREICMKEGGDLASIHSSVVMNQLMTWSNSSNYYSEPYWIGFVNLDLSGFKWSDSSEEDYTNWAPDYPKIDNNLERCAFLRPKTIGVWYTANCGISKGYICSRPVSSSSPTPKTTPVTKPGSQLGHCPRGFVDAGTKCFLVVQVEAVEGATWEEAIFRCRQEAGHFPDLASIHSDYENAVITSQMQTFLHTGLWIGLYEDGSSRTWYWADNTERDYVYWENGKADYYGGKCAEMVYRHMPMGHTGMWNNSKLECTDRRGYVCQTYKDPNSIISTPASTTVNICKVGWVPFKSSCYKLITDAKSWSDANKTCVEDGSELVSIQGDDENSFLFTLSRKLTDGAWIGLYRGSDEIYYWSNSWYVLFTHWAPYEPSTGPGGGCVRMDDTGRWTDDKCADAKPFFCETTTAPALTTPIHAEGKCPKAGDWIAWGDFCYKFERNDRGDWATAQEKCVKKYPYAQLASIHNAVENDFIYKNMLATSPWADAWIGLYRGKLDGEFKWVDREILQYSHWKPGSPEEKDRNHCVVMSMKSYPKMWVDVSCTQYQGYICKAPKREPVTTPANLPGECPADGWVPYGANCYLFEPDVFTMWDQAQAECQKRAAGDEETSSDKSKGALASIIAEHESDFISREMKARSHLPQHRNYWIGGRKEGVDADFLWTDGSPVTYDGWATDYPQSDPNGLLNCIEADFQSGHWKNTGCGNVRGFVCKVEKSNMGSSLTPQPSSQSSTASTMTASPPSTSTVTVSSTSGSSKQTTTPNSDNSTVAAGPTGVLIVVDHGNLVATIFLSILLIIVIVANLACILLRYRRGGPAGNFENPLATTRGGDHTHTTADEGEPVAFRHGSTVSQDRVFIVSQNNSVA